jgi:hypothetical protein
MTTKIEIVTKLDDGIYKGDGGGREVVRYSWPVGPRNLMTAFATLREHRETMVRSFGNIGAGGSWVRVGSTVVNEEDVQDCVGSERDREVRVTLDACRRLLAERAAAAVLGRKGGSAKSDKKAQTSKANGEAGGRPPEPCYAIYSQGFGHPVMLYKTEDAARAALAKYRASPGSHPCRIVRFAARGLARGADISNYADLGGESVAEF